MSRIAVLGCGWSGLMTSIRLKKLYPSVEVICIDRDFGGGLLQSRWVGGYLFDVGGSHIVFGKNPEVIKGILSMGGEWVFRERLAYILLNNTFIPYPFENGFHVLPPELRAKYGISLIRALIESSKKKPRNFKEWLLQTFGREMAKEYLIPYNEKIWKRQLDRMSADWVYIPGRLPLPSLEDLVKSIAGIPTVGYREQALFYYPRRGGIIKQWENAYKYAEALGVKFLKAEVREVKVVSGEYVINGSLKAGKIVNTLPLKEVPSIFGLTEDAFRTAERLDYNSLLVVGLGLKRPAPRQHWIYVPDKRITFHRYAWISNYGEDLSPDKSVLIVEITIPPSCKVNLEDLKARVVQDLVNIEVIREDEVEVVEAWYHKYGYPVYTLTHGADIDSIMQSLAEINISTFGRWGNWQYWNTEKIYEKATEMIF